MLEIIEKNIVNLRNTLNKLFREKREEGDIKPNPEDQEYLQFGAMIEFNKIGLLNKLGVSQSILPDIDKCCLYGIYVGYKTSFIEMDRNYKCKVRSRINNDDIITSILEADKFFKDFIKSIG